MEGIFVMTQLFSLLFLCLQGKVPLLPLEALHHLHIFIFVLAIVHVTFSVLTILFGGVKVILTRIFDLLFGEINSFLWIFSSSICIFFIIIKIRQWKAWEDSISQESFDTEEGMN